MSNNRLLEDRPYTYSNRWKKQWEARLAALSDEVKFLGYVPTLGPIGNYASRLKGEYRAYPELRTTARAREVESITGWSWTTSLDAVWNSYFTSAQEWYSHYPIDPPYSPLQSYLAYWIKRQRERYGNNKLEPERILSLESVAGWSWEANKVSQQKRSYTERELFALLELAIDEPLTTGIERGQTQSWQIDIAITGRKIAIEFDGSRFHSGTKNLNRDLLKTADLEAAGWTVIRVRESPLERCATHDVLYTGNLTKSAQEVLKVIECLGVKSKPDTMMEINRSSIVYIDHNTWDEKFHELKKYVEQEHTACVKTTLVLPSGTKIGSWVSTQRKNFSKNLLTDRQIVLLESLTEWAWEVRPNRFTWDNYFEEVGRFSLSNGYLPRKRHVTSDGMCLGGWVYQQWKHKRSGVLSKAKEEELETITGWYWR